MNTDYAQYSALGSQHQFWDGERLKEVANAPVNTPAMHSNTPVEAQNTPANKVDLVCLERLQLNDINFGGHKCHHKHNGGQ
jgi:hypothetical protein